MIFAQSCTGFRNGVPVVSYDGLFPPDTVGPYITETRRVIPVNVPALVQEQVRQVGVIGRIHSLVINLLKAFKGVLGDMNATSDLLRLVINATMFCEKTFHLPTLQLLAKAFVNITEFSSARSWLSRSYDVFSGEAATKEKIWGGYDYLRVVSKAIYLVNDICTTMKWLASIGVLGEIAAKEIATIQVFGKAIAVTVGRIGTIATLVGTIPNLVDNLRLVVKYSGPRRDMLERERKSRLVGFSLDTVSDICRIAGVILFTVSNPWIPFLALVVSTIGTLISLGKFYYTESTRAAREQEKAEYSAKKEAAIKLCDNFLRLGARQRGDADGVRVEAIGAVNNVLAYMDANACVQMQGSTVTKVSELLLRMAEANTQDMPREQLRAALQQKVALYGNEQ